MVSNEHLCLKTSHILHESDKLCVVKTMVEDKNSQTRIAAVFSYNL